MKIGEAPKRSGVSTRTIDYYTNSGLSAFERPMPITGFTRPMFCRHPNGFYS